MAETNHTRPFRKRRVRPYRGRGQVYSWLRAHHVQVAARLAAQELSWATLAEALSREGLKGRNGVELMGRAVAQVWRRVCRDVEAEAVARAGAAPKRKYPSRIPLDWRPQVASDYEGLGASIGSARVSGGTTPASPNAGAAAAAPTQTDTPMVFSTVDAEGNPLEESKVLYRGQVMTRHAAEQLERLRRGLREEDRFR